MGKFNLASAQVGDLTSTEESFGVAPSTLEGSSDQKETKHRNEEWERWLGYYREIPELKRAVDIMASWTMGKGYKATPEMTFILDKIKGTGKDSFNTILENMVRIMFINGDSYAEIIRDKEGFLINLMPLDPKTLDVISNPQGRIIRYEQTSKIAGKGKAAVVEFAPEKILHFSRNRLGDEILGQSIIKELEFIILARNEAMADWKQVLHRNIAPARIWHLDTDDETKTQAFISKVELMQKDKENIFIPMGNVEVEVTSVAPNSSLNALPTIEAYNTYFFEAVGVPQIVASSGRQFTDASSKISYLVWQQTIEEQQLFVEEQVALQLGIVINLIFPASLEQGILKEQTKEGQLKAAIPSDTIASLPGAD